MVYQAHRGVSCHFNFLKIFLTTLSHSPYLKILSLFEASFPGSLVFSFLLLLVGLSSSFPFSCYGGLVGPSKRGYNAKKRTEAALITAQNGMFF